MEIRKGDATYGDKLGVLARALLTDQRGIIFLGAGASVFPKAAISAPDGAKPVRLPTGTELAQEMAAAIKLDWHRSVPLSTVAFYYESFKDRIALNRWLVERLDADSLEIPPAISQLINLVQLMQQRDVQHLLLTTNYDRLVELAYAKVPLPADQLSVVVYNGGNDPNKYGKPGDVKLHIGLNGENAQAWYPRTLTTLYKLHGSITHVDDVKGEGAPEGSRNLVVTEEDYINFLGNISHPDRDKGLLQHISGRLSSCTILFIGYSLSDWNFRVIYKGTAEKHGNHNFAVQFFDHDQRSDNEKSTWSALVQFWSKKNLDIINCDAATFLEDLILACQEAPRAKARR